MIVGLLLLVAAQAKVLSIVELARHGERAPPYRYDWMHPEDVPSGGLLQSGYAQHVEIGKQLRLNYSDLLPETYNPQQVYARSTNFNRTKLSLQGQLEGIFGGKKDFMVNTTEMAEDYMLKYNACPKVALIQEKKNLKSTSHITILASAKKFQPLIEKLTGMEFDKESTFRLMDVITNYDSRGLKQHEGVDQEVIDFAHKYYHHYQANMLFGHRLQWKLAASEFVIELINTFEQVLEGKETAKVKLYGGHYVTLIPVMKALGQLEISPKVADFLLIELHQDAGDPYLVFKYNGAPFSVRWCPDSCSFSTFKEKSAKILALDKQILIEKCHSLKSDRWSWKQIILLLLGGCTLFSILVFLFAYKDHILECCRKPKTK